MHINLVCQGLKNFFSCTELKPYKTDQSGFHPKATMETAARESVDCQRHGFLQLEEDWLQDIIDRAGDHQMV